VVYENSFLSTSESAWNENSIVVYKPNDLIVVNSGRVTMKNIQVFDVRGRMIVEKNNVNSTESRIDVGDTNQVLLFKITSDDGKVVTKKYIN